MKMKATNENLTAPPKAQWASSIGQQLAGSLPASIALALAGTAISYHIGLPEAAAERLAMQIQAACLGGGVLSTAAAAFGFQARSRALTDAKIALTAPPKLPDTVKAGGDVNVGAASSNPVEFDTSNPVEFDTFGDAIPDDDGTPSE